MKRSKHGLFVFPPKKTLIWKSIVRRQSEVQIDFQKVLWQEVFFHPSVRLNQPKATRERVRSINQSNRSISVCKLFLFCSRVFISRSYENRSNNQVHIRNTRYVLNLTQFALIIYARLKVESPSQLVSLQNLE